METQLVDLYGIDADERKRVFDDPKCVHLGLDAGDSIPPHRHEGETVLFHVLDGELELTLGDETHLLDSGTVTRFSGDQDISPKALTASRAFLVFVPQN